MKPIRIECPHCRESRGLVLEKEARMIVMRCPACGEAMMYYYGKTFPIDSGEMEKIRDSRHMTTVQGIVQGPGPREAGPLAAVVRRDEATAAHAAGSPVREMPFAQDDITNLKIELELAKDVNDFIQGM